ncbi:MAG TPA: acyltransferase family protein [Patescibacteria group bacterium]|nr:acyltransferase family protein [Patescibacteria group bacterium]
MERAHLKVKKVERVEYMDIVKGIAILLVVVGHAGSPFQNFIYLFHMAAFFCVSGYFYKDHYSSNLIKMIKRRIKSLYLPFLSFELLFLCLHNLFYALNIYSNKLVYFGEIEHLYKPFDYLKNLVFIFTFHNTEQLLKPFWFLISLFVVNVLFSIISYLTTERLKKHGEKARFTLVLLCFVIGMVMSFNKIVLSLNLGQSLVALLIYYFGYLYKRFESHIPFNKYLMLLSFLFLVINSFYVRIEMSSNAYSDPFSFVINAVVGTYFIFGIAKFITAKKLKGMGLITFIGLNTLPLLALQLLSFKIVNLIQVIFYHYPSYMVAKFLILDGSHGWWIAYSLVGIFVPLAVVYAYKKIKSYIDFYIASYNLPILKLNKLLEI